MKMKHTMLAAGLAGLAFSQACKKKGSGTDDLVPANQTKGIMYCGVNGKSWNSDGPGKKYSVHYQDSNFSFDEDVYGTEGLIFGDTLTLSGVRVAGTDTSQLKMDIALTSARVGTYTLGTYPVNKAGKAFAFYYNKAGYAATKICRTGYNYSGTINITGYADSTGLVSGSFSFSMTPKNPSNPKTPAFNVVSGKFTDVAFKP